MSNDKHNDTSIEASDSTPSVVIPDTSETLVSSKTLPVADDAVSENTPTEDILPDTESDPVIEKVEDVEKAEHVVIEREDTMPSVQTTEEVVADIEATAPIVDALSVATDRTNNSSTARAVFDTPSTPLHEAVKPQVMRLNKWPLALGVLLITALVWLYLGTLHSTHATEPARADATSDQPATTDMQQWVKQQSNALPNHSPVAAVPTTTASTHAANTANSTATTSASSKLDNKQAQALQVAMDSPLSAAGISADTSSSSPSAVSSSVINPSPPETDNTSGASPLPITAQQAEKLQRLLGQSDDALDQNRQAQKAAFLANLKSNPDKDYLHESLNKPLSRYEIKAGTLIPAVLLTGTDSDLPGQVTAQVRQNVYDSVGGKHLLIPQGSKLIMQYNSNVAYGQSRIQVAAQRLIYPNGESINLEGMVGSDAQGQSGFHDQVNNHYARLFGSAVMMGLISAAFQVSQPQQSSALSTAGFSQSAAGAMGQQLAQVSGNMINKNLNIQPTLTIRPGYEFNISVSQDIAFLQPYTGD